MSASVWTVYLLVSGGSNRIMTQELTSTAWWLYHCSDFLCILGLAPHNSMWLSSQWYFSKYTLWWDCESETSVLYHLSSLSLFLLCGVVSPHTQMCPQLRFGTKLPKRKRSPHELFPWTLLKLLPHQNHFDFCIIGHIYGVQLLVHIVCIFPEPQQLLGWSTRFWGARTRLQLLCDRGWVLALTQCQREARNWSFVFDDYAIDQNLRDGPLETSLHCGSALQPPPHFWSFEPDSLGWGSLPATTLCDHSATTRVARRHISSSLLDRKPHNHRHGC